MYLGAVQKAGRRWGRGNAGLHPGTVQLLFCKKILQCLEKSQQFGTNCLFCFHLPLRLGRGDLPAAVNPQGETTLSLLFEVPELVDKGGGICSSSLSGQDPGGGPADVGTCRNCIGEHSQVKLLGKLFPHSRALRTLAVSCISDPTLLGPIENLFLEYSRSVSG